MSLSEFEIIKKHFNHGQLPEGKTSVAIGDDAAIINIPRNHHVVSTLTQWQEGKDYSQQDSGFDTGKKLLLCSLNNFNQSFDHANWMTLSISMLIDNEEWLTEFSQGLILTAKKESIQLVGGDTSKGINALRLHIIGAKKNT